MKATFVELPPFERTRKDYMDDDAYRLLQHELMDDPAAGDVMEGTGGLLKLRQADPRRGKGQARWLAGYLLLVVRRRSVLALYCL